MLFTYGPIAMVSGGAGERMGAALVSLSNALLAAKDQGLAFLKTAGTVIMAICILMWWLSAYPKAPAAPEDQRSEPAIPGLEQVVQASSSDTQ